MTAAAQRRTGLSKWEYPEGPLPEERRRASAVIDQWESESRPAWRKATERAWHFLQRSSRTMLLIALAFALGFAVSSGPQSAVNNLALRERLRSTHNSLTARQGELQLAQLELGRLHTVMQNSERYGIPADLAAKIYDIAIAEGIEPRIAFGLVNVESEFTHKAISPVGALGLTQLMPATAQFFQPGIERSDLFDPTTNLHIGFRFLKELIGKYDGNVDLALTAYNRGPSKVDRVVQSRHDPSNGYADAVLRGPQ
jgi:soluble lytic murein transglycosylase-like protein